MRALIVDDSAAAANQLTELIQEAGLRVVAHARTGVEALKLFPEANPDIVFLDIVMPDMDGIATLRNLKAIKPDVRAIVISSAGGVGSNVDTAMRLGAIAVLTKPINKAEFKAALAKVTG